jgi:hypothetical protein
MKRFVLLLSVSTFSLVFASCVHKKEVKVPQEKVEEIKAIGQKATKKLMMELKSNLVKALKEKGIVGAISFCAGKAEEITKEVNSELINVKVSRVSEKYRNPGDKPDEIDKKVLKYFEKKLKEGKIPPYYITAVKENGKVSYIFYKPLIVNQLCLNCHGPVNEMKPEIVKVIREKYPEDRAVNYKPGDLRGAVKVVIPDEAL